MRRLRENTMLEAEISPAGTVLVEGHHVGELQGFRFTADQCAGGEDGKAIKAAAQKALAAEFETRAERFSALRQRRHRARLRRHAALDRRADRHAGLPATMR